MDDAPGFQDPTSADWTMVRWKPDPDDIVRLKSKASKKAAGRIAGRNNMQSALNCAINQNGGGLQTMFNGFNDSTITKLVNGSMNPTEFLTKNCTPAPAEATDNSSLAMKCANDLSKFKDVQTIFAGLYPADAYLQRTECLGYSDSVA